MRARGNAPVLKVRGDAFTDRARTPWAGTRLASWKRALGIDAPSAIGESWEISFGPELPSTVVLETGTTSLRDAALADAAAYLGDEAALGASRVLVKLLDASELLSVQIHPADGDPALGPDESGKPECWWIASADPGARIAFGLAQDVDARTLGDALRQGRDVTSLLAWVEVRPGDFFVVPPGTPHAIGAGVTVVEPQRVTPGKRGITYRFFDHGRRYDSAGNLDPQGEPRHLHVREALRVTDWARAGGRELLARAHRPAAPRDPHAPLATRALSGPTSDLPFPVSVELLAGTGALTLPPSTVGRALVVVDGELTIEGARARRGESLFLPTRSLEVEGSRLEAIVASTPVDGS